MTEHQINVPLPNGSVERRKVPGIWVHWVGDFISLIVLGGTFLIAWGTLQESNRQITLRVEKVEHKVEEQQKADIEQRRDMKNDIQRELQNVTSSIANLDAKITAVLMNRSVR